MIFENIIWNWGDTILKVLCFHCLNMKATIVSSIKIYEWLSSSEYSNLSEINLLIREKNFSARSCKCRVCIHCNSNPKFAIQHENIGCAQNFHSPCVKRIRQKRFKNFIRKFFIVLPLAMKNPLFSETAPLKMLEVYDLCAYNPFEL